MAKTFNRICLRDYTIVDHDGTSFTLKRAKEYLTSDTRDDGTVIVFSQYWTRVPVDIFAGAVAFT